MKPQFDSTRPLTDSEREEFRTRDARFIKNWSSVWEAVSDLVFIQKNRLYREEFPSFEAYLKSRCNLGKAYAYQLIEAHGVIEKVKLLEGKIPRATEISNERQCRALAKVPDDRLECVVEKACELSGEKKLTAKILLQAKKWVAGQNANNPESIDAVSFDTIDIQPVNAGAASEHGMRGDFALKSVSEEETVEVAGNSSGERNPFPPLDPEREAQKLFNQFDYQGRLVIYETISSLWHLESGGKNRNEELLPNPPWKRFRSIARVEAIRSIRRRLLTIMQRRVGGYRTVCKSVIGRRVCALGNEGRNQIPEQIQMPSYQPETPFPRFKSVSLNCVRT